jgi:prepilin-type N-terminal cleavage/methylation domain-containing protein
MMTNKARASGFTLVEIMIVVAIIGLLAAIAIPNFVKARTTSQKNACINNLRQIDGAIQQYALENKKNAADPVGEANVTPYLKNSVTCPAGGTTFADSYTISDCQTAPTCRKVTDGSHVLPGATVASAGSGSTSTGGSAAASTSSGGSTTTTTTGGATSTTDNMGTTGAPVL